MASKVLRTCLIGAGRMGQLRAPILYSHPNVSLQHVVDPAEKFGSPLAAKYEAKFETSLDNIDLSNVDAMVISTGTHNHAEVITKAAEAKLPIFVEKPVHSEPDEIRRLFQICESHSVPLCCGFQRRFDSSYVAVRNAIADGRIGDPTMVRVMFADHPAPPMEFLLQGGCPYMDLAPHDLDFLCWALDDVPVSVYATGSSSNPQLAAKNVADTAMITLKFKKGAIGTLMMARGSTYGYDQRMEIFGTQGMVNLGNELENTCKVYTDSGIQSPLLKHSFPQRFQEAFQSEIDVFVQTCLGKTKWPITEQNCVTAQVIAAAAARSADLGEPVQL